MIHKRVYFKTFKEYRAHDRAVPVHVFRRSLTAAIAAIKKLGFIEIEKHGRIVARLTAYSCQQKRDERVGKIINEADPPEYVKVDPVVTPLAVIRDMLPATLIFAQMGCSFAVTGSDGEVIAMIYPPPKPKSVKFKYEDRSSPFDGNRL